MKDKPFVINADNIEALVRSIKEKFSGAPTPDILWTPIPLNKDDYDLAVANGYGPLVCLDEASQDHGN